MDDDRPKLPNIHSKKVVSEYDKGWIEAYKDGLVPGGSATYFGKSINPTDIHNLKILFTQHPSVKHRLAYNIFANDIMVIAPLPWDGASFEPRMLKDTDLQEFHAWQSIAEGMFADSETKRFKFDHATIKRMVVYTAKQQQVNPPRDFLEHLEWDGTPRLDYWLSDLMGAEQTPYHAFVGRKWLTAVVARIFKPGAAFDHCLIFEGRQRIGKSKTFEILATMGGQRYFHDERITFNSKEDAILCQGTIIIEMAELASWRKADNNDIKMFITRKTDRYRAVWGDKAEDHPRMYVLAGSINPDGGGYFTDDENTRYWPVRCGDERINLDEVEKWRDQLWAEAVVRYRAGEKLYLTEAEEAIAKEQQTLRQAVSLLEDDIRQAVNRLLADNYGSFADTVSISEVMSKLDVPKWQKNNRSLGMEIRRYLVQAGFKELRREGSRRWGKGQ